jgi:hypothetical protein
MLPHTLKSVDHERLICRAIHSTPAGRHRIGQRYIREPDAESALPRADLSCISPGIAILKVLIYETYDTSILYVLT